MPKIIDIKIIRGRTTKEIEEELREHTIRRKVAEVLYKDWKSKHSRQDNPGSYDSIESWVWNAHIGSNASEFTKVYERPLSDYDIDLATRAGITRPEKKPELSIEQQMLELIKDGWEPKGEMMVSDKKFCQTMVLYEGPTEDLLS